MILMMIFFYILASMEDTSPLWSKKRIYGETKESNTEVHALNDEKEQEHYDQPREVMFVSS